LKPGTAFLVEVPDDNHYYLPAGWAPWEFVYITFDGADLLRHAHWIIERQGPVLSMPFTHSVPDRVARFMHAVSAHQVPDVETLAEWLYGIMLGLRREAGSPQMLPHPPIARAMQFAARHFYEDIGVAELATAAGLSRAHFSRVFSRHVGVGPLEYLTRVRLQRALTLLRGTFLPLDEIATQCGFENASYFGKVFRKVLGLTPIAYRKGGQPCIDEQTLVP